MHINIDKLWDFKEKKDFDSVWDDIVDKYKITNIWDDDDGESVYWIVEALHDDYKLERANYEAYIEVGMDARVLMELRKSAVLHVEEKLYDFYRLHDNCKTVMDIKRHRKNYLKFLCDDYMDANWQYYYMMKHYLGYKGKDFYFDFEECYVDGNWRLQTNPDNYEQEFVDAHMYGELGSGAVVD